MKTAKMIFSTIIILIALLIQQSLSYPIIGLDFERNLSERRFFYDYDDSPLIFDDFASFENTFNRRRNIEAVQERQLDVYRPPFGLKEEILLKRLSEAEKVVGYDPLAKIYIKEIKKNEPENDKKNEIDKTPIKDDLVERNKREVDENENSEDDTQDYYHHRRTYPLMVF